MFRDQGKFLVIHNVFVLENRSQWSLITIPSRYAPSTPNMTDSKLSGKCN